ncbi:hypothetical protein BSKO_07472 [Bryopsis sp. KO-2023]|nr:hypothetical protein BSKO_07472 [Bryopsis sp. KO-2023]
MSNTKEAKSVCVIGGGLAGVVAAKALVSREFSVTLFEQKDKLGGLWVDTYYDAKPQTGKDWYAYVEKPFGEDVPIFPTAGDVVDYVHEFASEHGLLPSCKLGHKVEKVSRKNEASPWDVSYRNPEGEASKAEFDFVVVCTGMLNLPYIPPLPGKEGFQGEIMHSSEWKSPEQFEGKKVVVIGGGKSATDAVNGAVGPASAVHQVSRRQHWHLPLYVFKVIPFEILPLVRAVSWIQPSYHLPSTTAERMLKWIFAPLIWLFFRLMEMDLRAQYGFPKYLNPTSKVEVDLGGLNVQAASPEYIEAVRSKKVEVHLTTLESFEENAVVLKDGTKLEADLVVMATGYTHDFPVLNEAFKDKLDYEFDGLWLYRQMVHPDIPSLAFVGSNVSSHMSLPTFSIQAAWVAKMFSGGMQVPSPASMWKEVENMKAIRREILDDKTSTAMCVSARMVAYHDALCRDMGSEPRGEGWLGWLRSCFIRALPETYRDYI